MAEYCREAGKDRRITVDQMQVGVAETCGGHLDEHLAGSRSLTSHFGDRQELAVTVQNRNTHSDPFAQRNCAMRGSVSSISYCVDSS